WALLDFDIEVYWVKTAAPLSPVRIFHEPVVTDVTDVFLKHRRSDAGLCTNLWTTPRNPTTTGLSAPKN
ncbi:MAG: hypothetical protein KC910_38655, partial [Candidatus Eremiobacteraeota bacterium]|nr:hypothetical protein [Candidatus Eremiobacteraeota bacterium]